MSYTYHMQFPRKYAHLGAVLALAVLAFFIYSWLYFFAPAAGPKQVMGSPDEAAALYFSQEFARNGNFTPTPEEQLPDFVHPRSAQNLDGHLVPGGFLGQLVVYGVLARVFHSSPLGFTAFFSAMAGLAMYGIFRNIGQGKKSATLAAAFFLFHPAVVYYASRGLLPNMFFMDLLIFAAFLFSTFVRTGRNTLAVLAAFLVGISLTVRPIESGWVAAGVLLFLIFQRKRISGKLAISMAFYFAISFIPFFYYNFHTYGSIFHTGYASVDAGVVPAALTAAQGSALWQRIMVFILPFGFHLKTAFLQTWQYALWMFAPLTALALLGVAKFRHEKRWYLLVFALVSAWLLLLYASWQVTDNISGQVGIGVSQVRYWLPIYVMSIPFLVAGTLRLPRRIVPLAIVAVLGYCLGAAFFLGPEALASPGQDRARHERAFAQVSQQVSENAIIVSERSDKIFFPQYQVIDVSLASEAALIWPRLGELEDPERLYYFSIFPEGHAEEVNDRHLRAQGLEWAYLGQIEEKYFLYKMRPLP